MTPLEGPQLIGPVDVSYALCVEPIDPYQMAEDVLVPWSPRRRSAAAPGLTGVRQLTVRGAEVSAVRRQAGQPRGAGVQPAIDSHGRGDPGPLRSAGRPARWPVAPFDGTFDLHAHGIATARLDEG